MFDVERLDDAAGRAMAGRAVDLVDVRRRASSRRRRDRAKGATWTVLAAAAAVLIGDAKVAMTPAFGRATSVNLLAWDSADAVWLTVSSPACAMCMYRFSLADGSKTLVIRTAGSPDHPIRDITVAAHDVAAGGQIASRSAPSWPWYQPERIRWVLAGLRPLLFLLLIVVALGAVRYGWRRMRAAREARFAALARDLD